MRSRLSLPAAAAALTLTVTGCGALTEDDAAAPDSRTIAVGLYPLEYVASRVAGDGFGVENLTAPGAEPHDAELGIGQTADVANAALLVYVGGLQPGVDEAAEETAEGRLLDVAEVVDLVPFAESDHDEDEHAEDEDHDHGEEDPHFWHDPLRMAEVGDAVAEQLAEIDPDNAADYRANAETLRADLEALDREFAEALAGCEVTTVVTNHDAFGYLAKYGLHLESINGISPNSEPTPAALADLADLIEEEGVTTVFSETLVSPDVAETLARDAGVETGVLDTVEGLSDETSGEDYLSLMRQNLTALREANRC